MAPPSRRRPGQEIERLVDDLGKLDKDLKRELRPAIREAAKEPLAKARANASWSSRISGATKIGTRLAGKHPGVRLETNRKKAPHARVWEGITGRQEARWPVFGNRDVWVTRNLRSYLSPAVEDSADDVADAIDDAVVDVARRYGFR